MNKKIKYTLITLTPLAITAVATLAISCQKTENKDKTPAETPKTSLESVVKNTLSSLPETYKGTAKSLKVTDIKLSSVLEGYSAQVTSIKSVDEKTGLVTFVITITEIATNKKLTKEATVTVKPKEETPKPTITKTLEEAISEINVSLKTEFTGKASEVQKEDIIFTNVADGFSAAVQELIEHNDEERTITVKILYKKIGTDQSKAQNVVLSVPKTNDVVEEPAPKPQPEEKTGLAKDFENFVNDFKRVSQDLTFSEKVTFSEKELADGVNNYKIIVDKLNALSWTYDEFKSNLFNAAGHDTKKIPEMIAETSDKRGVAAYVRFEINNDIKIKVNIIIKIDGKYLNADHTLSAEQAVYSSGFIQI